MPWSNVQSLLQSVPALKAWPAKYREQFLAVANECLASGREESSCIAQAWGVIQEQAETDQTEARVEAARKADQPGGKSVSKES